MNYKKISFFVTIGIVAVLSGVVGTYYLKHNSAVSLLNQYGLASLLDQPIQDQSSGNFAVLANSTITNTGSSVITGDLGLSPGTSVTGFPPGIVNGTQHITDATAATGQTDLTTAYNEVTDKICTQTLTGTDLGTLTLTP